MQRKLRSKKLSLALTVIFLCSIVFSDLPVQPAYAQFSDIRGSWAEKQINDWADKGLAGGYPDGTFKPNSQITRAEFVALTNRAFGKQNPAARADFEDVKESNWFYTEVAAATAAGYTAGYTDGTFKPLNPITRQEAASIVARLLQLDAGAADQAFADDGAIAPWARAAVGAVAAAGIMGGYPDGSFKGANPITRAEAVATLDRALAARPAAAPEGITGIITQNGKAVEGAVVLLFAENGTEPIKEAASGKDGGYAFQVAAGTYDLTAAKDKYVQFAAKVLLAKDGVVQNLALAEGTLISGQLVDKNGKVIKNARLFFTTNPTFLTTTEGSGNFKVYVPAGKQYAVRGYKNNQPASGLETLAEAIEAGAAGSQPIGIIRASYSLVSGGGGGGSGGPSVPPSDFAGGAGTKANPYQIATADQLNKVRNYLDKHFVQVADINLGAAPWNQGQGWEPIGDSDNHFAGSYNGGGYSINGLYINRNTNNTGLFGYLGEGGEITGVNILNAQVRGGNYTGILAGYANNAAINTSHVEGTVTGGYWVAGLLAGEINNSEIRGCSSDGEVSATYYAGGLVGKAEFSLIKMSFSTAEVTSGNRIGALIGELYYSHVEGCLAAGNVSGTEYAGGLVHSLGGSSSVKSSYALGNVTVTGTHAGGLAAEMWGDSFVSMSYAMGNVSGTSGVGGLVGNPSSGDIYHSIGQNKQIESTTGSIYIGRIAGGKSEDYNLFQNNHGYAKMKVSGDPVSSADPSSKDGSDFLGFYEIQAAEISDPAPFEAWDFDAADADGNGVYWQWDHDISRPVLYVDPEGSVNFIRLGNDTRVIEPVIDDTPSDFAGGAGTEGNPYQVATAEQLDSVRNYLDKHFIQIADINLTDYLGEDGDGYNEGKGWVPIGSSSSQFTGSYDGDGYKIIGLTFTDPDNGWYTGLFGHTSKDAALDNITLQDATLNGKSEIGSLVGKNYGTVSNCSSINVDLAGYMNVGGLIGINYGVVEDSYTSGAVVCTYAYVGGLIGENASYSGAQYLDDAGSVLNCYSSANVTGVEVVGGLIGNDSRGNIEYSYSSGQVIGTDDRVGGLIGDAYDTQIRHCYATGNVAGAYDDVGGLVGEASGTLIEDCYASGNVSGPANVGGLVGDHSGSIANCHSNGTVTGTSYIGGLVGYNTGSISDSHSDGAVTGTNRVGGLVGYNYNTGTVSKSYSTSSVTGTGVYNEFIGGLVGYNNGPISQSYASGNILSTYLCTGGLVGYNFQGTITDCYAMGNVTGNSRVGGLVGDNRQQITNSYATGAVSGTSDVGGLVGDDNGGTYASCYYDQNTTGQTDTGKGEPKTTAAMQEQSTYAGWDFAIVWGINPDENEGYPFLRWQGYEHVPTSVLDEDFEGYTAGEFPSSGGWVLKYGGMGADQQYVTDLVSVSGDQSFRLWGDYNWSATVYKTVDIPVRGILEGWVRTEATAGLPGGVAHIGLTNPDVGAWGTYIASAIFADGKIYAVDASHELQTFEIDTWYHIRIVYDLAEQTADFYVDDVKKASDVPIGSVTPTAVFLIAGNQATVISYFDDIILCPGS